MMSRILIIVALSAIAACAKSRSEEATNTTVDEAAGTAEPASAEAEVDEAEVDGKNMDPRCSKFRDDVSKVLGTPVTALDYWEPINGGAMRCIYNTATGASAAFEIGPSGDLAAERKGFEKGGKPSDSTLGAHAFRVEFGGLNHVIGNKGTKRIAILSNRDFAALETFWQTLAAAE